TNSVCRPDRRQVSHRASRRVQPARTRWRAIWNDAHAADLRGHIDGDWDGEVTLYVDLIGGVDSKPHPAPYDFDHGEGDAVAEDDLFAGQPSEVQHVTPPLSRFRAL